MKVRVGTDHSFRGPIDRSSLKHGALIPSQGSATASAVARGFRRADRSVLRMVSTEGDKKTSTSAGTNINSWVTKKAGDKQISVPISTNKGAISKEKKTQMANLDKGWPRPDESKSPEQVASGRVANQAGEGSAQGEAKDQSAAKNDKPPPKERRASGEDKMPARGPPENMPSPGSEGGSRETPAQPEFETSKSNPSEPESWKQTYTPTADAAAAHTPSNGGEGGARMYVYDLPPELHINLEGMDYPNKRMVEFESRLIDLLKNNPMNTNDPALATSFFVPMTPVAHCAKRKAIERSQGCLQTRAYLKKGIQYIRNKYKDYWKNDGHNHLLMSGYDWGICMATFRNDASREQRPTFIGNARVIGFLGFNEAGKSPGSCWKPGDITLPPYVDAASRTLLTGAKSNREDRPLTLFYRGDRTNNLDKDFRENLERHFHGVEGTIISSTMVDIATYTKEMRSSKFCLVPPGHAPWTYRFSEAILAGCIPVLTAVADVSWGCGVNPTDVGVVISANEADPKVIMDRVKALSPAAVASKQARMTELSNLFSYNADAIVDCLSRELKR